MNKKIIAALLFLVAAIACYLTWDFAPPTVVMDSPPEVGAGSRIVLSVEDSGRGVESLQVLLKQGEYTRILREVKNQTVFWPWKKNPSLEMVELVPADWMDRDNLKEGAFELLVTASDTGDYGLFNDTAVESFPMTLDLTPPRIEILSSQHNVRRGGAESVRYRIRGGSSESGVIAGDHVFKGFPVDSGGEGVYAAVFVWAYDEPEDIGIKLWAEDAVGNRTETALSCQKIERQFRERKINISEGFIDRVTPEIIRLSPDVQEQGDPLGNYLVVNQELRIKNNQQIKELTTPVSGGAQWDQAFLQMRNSKVEALFADHRSYYFNGEKVDEQTHLGYDLASTTNCPIESANNGTVVFADNLGIYGNCIILDHGMGVYSLYGHLSSIDVQPGARVSRGDIIGRSGQTGLAGGDHLHYSMLVQGVQTNPLEWWDSSWIKLHILDRVSSAGS